HSSTSVMTKTYASRYSRAGSYSSPRSRLSRPPPATSASSIVCSPWPRGADETQVSHYCYCLNRLDLLLTRRPAFVRLHELVAGAPPSPRDEHGAPAVGATCGANGRQPP